MMCSRVLRTEAIMQLISNNWGDRSHVMYVELKEGATQQQAEMQFKEIDIKYVPDWYIDMATKGAKPDKFGDLLPPVYCL